MNEKTKSAIETVVKIDTAKVFGDGKALLGSAETVSAGRIIGSVEKVIDRSIPGGGKYQGLAGVFEVLFPNGDVKRAGQCYFPAAVHSQIAAKLAENARLDLIVQVNAVKAGDGVSWNYVPEHVELNADPLSHLRAKAQATPEAASAKAKAK